jgi:putative transcriptional regulator
LKKPGKKRAIRIPFVDVGEVRQGTGLSVEDFARRFGLTSASVRSWEQGQTEPYSVAKILLAVIASHPEVVDEVLRDPIATRWDSLRDR